MKYSLLLSDLQGNVPIR